MATQLIFIAIGGALGAVCRYLTVAWLGSLLGNDFPYGTMAVNILGSLLIGVAFVLIVEKIHLFGAYKPIVMVGFLGAFTTFSTFSLESYSLIQGGKVALAMIYISSSVILCVLATALSIWGTRLVFKIS